MGWREARGWEWETERWFDFFSSLLVKLDRQCSPYHLAYFASAPIIEEPSTSMEVNQFILKASFSLPGRKVGPVGRL